MSAIWGAINLEGEKLTPGQETVFHDAYRDCVIDRAEYLREGNVLMGCELQYFTIEAEKEHLPYHSEKGSYFVADVYLDNRSQLLQDPLFAGADGEIPDGELLFRYFEAYGKQGLKKVHGSYSFVHYDPRSGIASVAADHLCNRCLYYAVIDQVLYFSTLMEPIVLLNRERLHPNKKVLQDFMAIPDMRVYLDHEATIFSEIRHITAGEIMEFTAGDAYCTRFWEPLKGLSLFRNKTDEEYRRELQELLRESVSQSLRSAGETGIFLSSGLDSTAVACVAAPLLRERGKQLYSYTMIPMQGYQDDTGERVNVNEQELVRCTAGFLGNVKEHYESLDRINAWDCMEAQIRLLEGPFKSLQNVVMLGELGKMAYRDGCRIVLNGQLGNDTISYGDTAGYLYELFRYGRWMELWKETGRHNKYFRYNRKKVCRQILERMFPSEEKVSYREFQKRTLVRGYSQRQYEEMSRMRPIRTRKDYMPLILDRMRFRQIGDNETKLSLRSGVLIKDPTRNIDLLEWCLRLPTEQFQKNCTNRRLIYEYLSDVITPELLDQRLPKGRQSADEFFRLEGRKAEMYSEMRRAFGAYHGQVLDIPGLLKRLEEAGELFRQKTCSAEDKRRLEELLYAYELCRIEDYYF